jgi:hypothetical protein
VSATAAWLGVAGAEQEVRVVKDLPAATFQVTRLDLAQTKVSDAGLAHLKGLTLEILDLNGTNVSDAGLKYFLGMGFMGDPSIDLTNTRVSVRGFKH